jgi:hypothetical protein
VQELAKSLAPGQTGCLLAGTFTEHVNVSRGGRAGARLRLTAAPGARPRFCGRIEVKDSANYVTISNLRLDGSCTSENMLQIWGDFVTVRGNEITNRRSSRSCVFVGHHSLGLAYNTMIARNRIHDCGRDIFYDHGIYAAAARSLRISNNYIYDSGGWGIHLYPDVQGALVDHNVVDGSPESGILISGDDSQASSHVRVAYNIFSWNRKHGIDRSWGGPVGNGNVAEFNCLWGNGSPFDSGDGYRRRNNLLANPRYAGRARKNFRLRRGTLCAGMGPRS